MDADICYLLLVPFQPRAPLGPLEPIPAQKDAPYFFDLDIEFRSAGERQLVVEGASVSIRLQVLDEQVWLAEGRYRLADFLSEAAAARHVALKAALKQELQRASGYTGSITEQYTSLLLQTVESAPDEFVDQHSAALARLLRSLTEPLGEADAREIVASRTRYSEHDLTVVDWAGAVIIAKHGDYQSDIELMKIGCYQLLRYRMLDRAIERSLQTLRQSLASARITWLPRPNQTLQQIVEQRLALLLDFEKTDQSLLLIGDWYSARVYRLIVEQFDLKEWKATVSAKLDSLAAIDGIVRQDLAFSWRRLLDIVQFVGWLVLLVGYFVLFVLDVSRYR